MTVLDLGTIARMKCRLEGEVNTHITVTLRDGSKLEFDSVDGESMKNEDGERVSDVDPLLDEFIEYFIQDRGPSFEHELTVVEFEMEWDESGESYWVQEPKVVQEVEFVS
jgi:hypothetical protein